MSILDKLTNFQKWAIFVVFIITSGYGAVVFAMRINDYYAKTKTVEKIQYQMQDRQYESRDRYLRDEQRGVRRHNNPNQEQWAPSVREDMRQLQEDRSSNRRDWDNYRSQHQGRR